MRRAALAMLFALFVGEASASSVEVTIPQGALRGDAAETIAAFKNIPFAAPPVASLRWRAPASAPGWTGTRKATEFGPICPQNRRKSSYMPDLPQSEDCLTLNVWTPKPAAGAKLPVMVWIYGGAFVEGGSAAPIYDGTDLAKHGVVVVTLNYRLGLLGFFAHPALTAEHLDTASGNFGLLDQIAALKWVQDNIASFGGDPAKVTIFGESAGGISVNDLIASPMAQGLFIRAISESGLGLNDVPPQADVEKEGVTLAQKLGVAGDDADTLARLRGVTVADILKLQSVMTKTEGQVRPFVDGKVLPGDVSVLYAKGQIAKVDYLAGTNSNEASLARGIGLDPLAMTKDLGEHEAQVRAIYETGGKLTDEEFGRQFFNDALFNGGAQLLAGFETKVGGTAHLYHFAYLADSFRGKQPGVNHGGEVAFVFGLRGLGFYANFASDRDESVVALTQDYWTNFAKTGDPNGPGLPEWPVFTLADQKTLVIDDETKAAADFRRAQVGVIDIGWRKKKGLASP